MTTALYPPGPKRRVPGQFVFGFRRDPLGFLTRLAHDYGDISYFKMGPQHVYFVNDP